MNSQVKLDENLMNDYFDMLLFYLDNPEYACEDLLGIKLTPPEEIILNAAFRGENIDCCLGRAMAKSFSIGVTSCLMAGILETNIGIWSGSDFRGGKIVFEEYIDKILMGNVNGQDSSKNFIGTMAKKNNGKAFVAGSDKWVARVGNSKIITAPVTDKTRGFRTIKNFIDERNTMDQEKVNLILKPFSYHDENVHSDQNEEPLFKIEKSQELNYGTPSYVHYPWSEKIDKMRDYYKEEDFAPLSGYFFINLNFLDAYKHKLNIKEMVKDLENPDSPIEEASAEILAIPIKSFSHKFFNPISINSLPKDAVFEEQESSSGWEYSIGVDTSQLGFDKSFVVVTKKKPNDPEIYFVGIYVFDTKEEFAMNQVSDKIKNLYQKFSSIIDINIDSRGGGSHLRDLLAATNDSYGFGLIEKKYLLEAEKNKDKYTLKNQYPIITLLTVTDELNTRINLYTKGRIEAKKLHVFDYHEKGKTEMETEQFKLMDIVLKQFKNIQRVINNNNMFTFFVPKKKKKDGWAATNYSLLSFMLKESETKKEANVPKKKKRRNVSKNYEL